MGAYVTLMVLPRTGADIVSMSRSRGRRAGGSPLPYPLENHMAICSLEIVVRTPSRRVQLLLEGGPLIASRGRFVRPCVKYVDD